MQRITVSIADEQAERLKNEQLRTGAPVSLQIRRALDLAKICGWSRSLAQKASTENERA
jgi:hypothetical protein